MEKREPVGHRLASIDIPEGVGRQPDLYGRQTTAMYTVANASHAMSREAPV